MRVPDEALEEVRSKGFVLVEGFLHADELAEAQQALPAEFPTGDTYFADPSRYAHLVANQFAGLRKGPFKPLAINRLGYHSDLVDAAERLLDTTDIALYKTELWAKYSGAVDYEQPPHRDFGNHNLVVPRADRRWQQMTTFILLSDVSDDDGPTRIIPRTLTDHIARSVRELPRGEFSEDETAVTGAAGTLFIYTTDVFHRGTAMTGHPRSRFAFLADFMARGAPWMGRIAWADTALHPAWDDILGDASPRQRELFGFPRVGHEYWNEQTLTDVGARWPSIDMEPYRSAGKLRPRGDL